LDNEQFLRRFTLPEDHFASLKFARSNTGAC
jgi:hypothetical protein